MKLLIENWRRFVEGKQPHYRLVVNKITQLTEQQLKEFPLSEEERDRIKEWGELTGDPSFLGSGTMGSAYLFDDNKVLKITSDFKEAQAAKLIEGEKHPNVYEILKVARRWDVKDRAPEEESRRPFIIVYEMVGEPGLVNFPTDEQKEVIKKAEATVNRRKTWLNWTEDFEIAKENFLKAAEEYNLEKEITPKFKSEEDKLDSVLDTMEGGEREKDAIKLAFIMSVGLIGGNLNSFQAVEEVVQSDKFNNVADLANGLTFLKGKGINFTDLKTSNVMNVDGRLIIIDIGKSRIEEAPEIEAIGEEK